LPHWTLHDLRRTFSTGLGDLGIPPHVVEAILNHISSLKSGVAGTYNKALYLRERTAALELWAAHVMANVADEPAKIVPIRAAS
jgi:integrase